MKRILAAFLALLSISTMAATLTPIQLLSPVGSTSGQVIASTGATTAPAWTTVTLSGLGGLAKANNLSDLVSAATARTNLGLGTSATINTGTSGATIPLLSTANTWTLAQAFTIRPTFNGATPWDGINLASPAATTGNLSQFAATTSAQLAGVISDETGSGSLVFGTTPTITTPNIIGTIAGGNAASGSIGEYVTASFTSTALTNNTLTNLASISLAAGDWDVVGHVSFIAANTTGITYVVTGINTTSAALPVAGRYCQWTASWPTNGAVADCSAPATRVNVTTTTTVYLVGESGFSTSTLAASGFLTARRAH